MSLSQPLRIEDGEAVARPPSCVGDLSDAELFARLNRVGFFRREEDRLTALALVVLARRLSPSALVMRFADALPSAETPLTVTECCNTLARFGFAHAVIKTTPGSLDHRLGPSLVMLPHPCVLYFRSSEAGRSLVLYDSQTQQDRVLEAGDPLLHKTCKIHLYRAGEQGGAVEDYGTHRREGQSWFGHTLMRLRRTILFLGLVGFLLTTSAMAVPIIILLMYDQVVGPRSMDAFFSIATGGALIALSEVQLRYLRARALAWMTARLDFLVGTSLFEKFLTLPPRVAEQVPISSHIARIRTFESVRDFFSGPVLVSALGLPATALGLLIILMISGPLVLVSLTAIAAYLLLAPILWRKVRLAIEDAALEGSTTQSFMLETFQKRSSIQDDGLQEKWAEKFRELSGASTAAQYRLFMLGQVCETIGSVISSLVILATLWVGAQLVWSGALSVGALIAVTMLTWNCLYPFHSLLSLLPRFEQSRKCINQINQFIDTNLLEDDDSGDVPVPPLRGEVDLRGVAVRYSKAAGPVFSGVNLSAAVGELVVVTGPNGCGKSSLLKLVAGLEAPMLGAVKLDGFNIRQLNLRDLRRRIAYVPQDAAIFRGSVAENLRVSNRLAEEDALWAALKLVGAHEEVSALPEGLHTRLEAKGKGLSELLIQRITLARGLLLESQLLVIDERPAAALRAGLDRDLKRMILGLQGKRTIFLATNRTDFMRLANKVVALRPMQSPLIGSPDGVMDQLQ